MGRAAALFLSLRQQVPQIGNCLATPRATLVLSKLLFPALPSEILRRELVQEPAGSALKLTTVTLALLAVTDGKPLTRPG